MKIISIYLFNRISSFVKRSPSLLNHYLIFFKLQERQLFSGSTFYPFYFRFELGQWMVIRSIYAGVTLYNGYTVVNKYNIVGYVQIPDWQVLTRGSVVTLLVFNMIAPICYFCTWSTIVNVYGVSPMYHSLLLLIIFY